MIRYTTPAISLLVEGKDLTGQDVYVSLEQGKTKLTKTGTDLVMTVTEEGTEIVFTLSQTESAMFDYGTSVSIQVNFINSSGVRDATESKSIGVMRNLLDEVIAYGD